MAIPLCVQVPEILNNELFRFIANMQSLRRHPLFEKDKSINLVGKNVDLTKLDKIIPHKVIKKFYTPEFFEDYKTGENEYGVGANYSRDTIVEIGTDITRNQLLQFIATSIEVNPYRRFIALEYPDGSAEVLSYNPYNHFNEMFIDVYE